MDMPAHDELDNTPFTISNLDGDGSLVGEGSELERLHASARIHQAWLLVIVLIVGIGSIWMMRSLGAGPQAAEASTADQVVGSYLESQGSLLAMGMSESILDVLQQSYVNEQVPLSDLRMNPFMPTGGGVSVEEGAPTGYSPYSRLDDYIDTLTVQSTMTGGTQLASIDGQVLRLGERLEGVPGQIEVILVDVQRHSIELKATDTETGTTGSWTLQVGR